MSLTFAKKILKVLLFLLPAWASSPLVDFSLTNPIQSDLVSLSGASLNDQFGSVVSSAGDINHDGFQDVIIGAHMANSGAGIAYLLYGSSMGIPSINFTSASLSITQGIQIKGSENSHLGVSASCAGDFNGDGIDDIVIGADRATFQIGGYVHSGAVYVIFGKETGLIDMDFSSLATLKIDQGIIIRGPENSSFGNSVNNVGDFNGDGIDDIIIGAYTAYSGAGGAYVIYGSQAGVTEININAAGLSIDKGFIIQGKALSGFGVSVSNAGDFNRDGFSDIIIGASLANSDAGAAYIIYGKSTGLTNMNLETHILVNNQGFTVYGIADSHLGKSVSSAGDINGDGYTDILLGAYMIHSNAGAAYLIYGSNSEHQDVDLNVISNLYSSNLGFKVRGTSGSNLGFSVSRLGDVNGDSIDDIIIGANMAFSSSGAAYIIYGSKTGLIDIDLNVVSSLSANNRGFIIQGAVNSRLGHSVSAAGDINGDGGNDVVIGAPYPGSALIILGVPVSDIFILPNSALKAVWRIQDTLAQSIRASGMVTSLMYFNNIASLWSTVLVEMLQYVKYMQITAPSRLKVVLEEPKSDTFEIPWITSAPKAMEDSMEKYSIPTKFDEDGLHSSFLINFWPKMMMILIIAFLISIIFILEWATRNRKAHFVFNKAKEIVKWNYVLALFTGYYCYIVLYTSLEIRTQQFSSPLEWLSFFLCLILNIAALAVLIKIFLVLKDISKQLKRINQTNDPRQLRNLTSQEFRDYQIIFDSFKNDSLSSQSYMFAFIFRLYLFYIVIGYLFEYPLVQTILTNLIEMGILIYLGYHRPFKGKVDMAFAIIQESILELVNFCVFSLVVTDSAGLEPDSSVRVTFGDIIIISSMVFMVVGVIFAVYLIVTFLIGVYKLIKLRYSNKKVTPINPSAPTRVVKKKFDQSIISFGAESDRSLFNESMVLQNSSIVKDQRDLQKSQVASIAENDLAATARTDFSRVIRLDETSIPTRYLAQRERPGETSFTFTAVSSSPGKNNSPELRNISKENSIDLDITRYQL